MLPFIILSLLLRFTPNECGTERWSIKTLSDADTSRIDFSHVVESSVHHQVSLPPVSTTPDLRRQLSEDTVYRITAEITDYKFESVDRDFHIVMKDLQSGETLVAEIPDPERPEIAGTSRVGAVANERQWFLGHVGHPTSAFKHPKKTTVVTFTGVGFYDFAHGQRGLAPNNREIHPILSIAVAAGYTPDASGACNP